MLIKQERLLKIILKLHISEKSRLGLENNNLYVFRVIDNATKLEIKDAVEQLFNTRVKSVRIVNVKPKARIFRGRSGTKQAWKKAYVSLQSGQQIDVANAVYK